MDRFYGFDLGDAESAVSRLARRDQSQPEVLPIADARSFITAYAQLETGEVLIGEEACYSTQAVYRSLRFKSRFLSDQQSEKDLRRFAAGVLNELLREGHLMQNEDCCFYIGCPAGWTKADRERYRRIFEDAGYPPARVISESRAALVSACQSRHFQVGYDIVEHPVLVVDVGSSTTDFAYILGGKEVELQTAGEVFFGGGRMDELLLEESLKRAPNGRQIRDALDKNPLWKSYCEFTARRVKEKYFSDQEYWQANDLSKTVRLMNDPKLRLSIAMDGDIADAIVERPSPILAGKSFHQTFIESLRAARSHIRDHMPELVFLTGGVSKMPAVRDWCQEVFPEAVVITGAEPEFSVSRGLAYCGRIDEELRAFRREVQDLIDTNVIDRIVERRIDDLYSRLVDTLVHPMMTDVVMPVFDRWRSAEIRALSDIDKVLAGELDAWLHSDKAQALLVKPITDWLKPVAYEIEDQTMPICVRHNVPYKALSLSSYLTLGDLDIRIDARDMFAVEGITWLINAIISILVGLLCGGSGIALLSSGVGGVVAGAIGTLLVLFLGKDKMQELVMNMDVPRHLRRLIPRAHFENRLGRIEEDVRAGLHRSLEDDKNTEITERLTREISDQIEECLNKMAEIVEIPL
ncbi:MAG: hypothetical protein E7317_03150 [Clostridiales bacterium]|nr:hypothetical protein [Clostridiales bacterium]